MLHDSLRSFLNAWILLTIASPALSLTFTSERIEATFDEFNSHKNAFEHQEVQQYGSLQWDGFSIDSPHQGTENEYRGVEVKSKPNFAGGRVDVFGGLPTIKTQYPSSQVSFFDLEKFWWGCSTKNEHTGEPGPGWCTLEIYGYSPGAAAPTSKAISFFFPKEDVKSMEMVEVSLPSSFKALTRVTFNVVATNPTLFVDNVQYKVYNVTSIGRGLGEVIHSQHAKPGKDEGQVWLGAGPAPM